ALTDEEGGSCDVLREGGGQEQLPVLYEGGEHAVDRAARARDEHAPRFGAERVHVALPAEGQYRDGRNYRRGGAAALVESRPRHRVAGPLHPGRRGHRSDRADRTVGAEDRVCTERRLAEARPAADSNRCEPLAPSVQG